MPVDLSDDFAAGLAKRGFCLQEMRGMHAGPDGLGNGNDEHNCQYDGQQNPLLRKASSAGERAGEFVWDYQLRSS